MPDPRLEYLGRQLTAIESTLREIKFSADVDRRNTRASHDNLVAEIGVRLGTFEARIEHHLEDFKHRIDSLTAQLERIEGLLKG